MKKIPFVLIGSFLITLLLVSTVYAQEGEGYPLETTTPTEVSEDTNPICDGTRIHPVLDGFSTKYNIPYDVLLVYYCQLQVGIGEIALALQTNQLMGGEVTVEELFTQRVDEGLGWGEIWQDLNLIGNDNGDSGDGQGHKALLRNTQRNEFQEQIQNEGEDNQLQNVFQNQENNGNKPDTPPGQDGNPGNGNKPDTPPGLDGDPGDGNKPETPPGQDDNPGNGNKPETPPGQDDNPGNGNKPETPPGQDGNPGNGAYPPGQENNP